MEKRWRLCHEVEPAWLQEAEAIETSPIPPELMSSPVEDLMDYVASHLIDWTEQHKW